MTDVLTAPAPSDRAVRVGGGPTPAPASVPRRGGSWLLQRWPYLVPLVVLSVLYGQTLQRSTGNAFSDDTTKFDYLGRVLGTAHPPGYPLYTMADAVIVRLVPVGSTAYRANLLSAVCAVALAVVLVDVLRRLGAGSVVAAAGATAAGLVPAVWQFAVVAEVYTMGALFVALVLACLVRYETTRKRGWLRAGVLVLALSFAHATADVLLVPGLLAYLAVRRVGWLFRPRELAVLLPLSAALALVPYSYLFWRTAAGAPFLDVRVDDLPTFWATITGERYGHEMFAVPAAQLAGRLEQLGGAVWAQFGVLVLLAVVGLVTLARRRALMALVLSVWAVCIAGFTLAYDVADWVTMLLPLWLVLSVWVACGIDGLVRMLRSRFPGRIWLDVAARLATSIVLVAGTAAAGYHQADRSEAVDPQLAVDRAVSLAGDDAVVFTAGNLERHLFLYRLLPADAFTRRNLWVAKGTDWSAGPGRSYTAQIRSYCVAGGSRWTWGVQELAEGPGVPTGLRTFAFGSGYAAHLRAEGLRARHVSGQLFRVSCPG